MQEPRRERWPNLLGVDRVRAENGGPNHYKALLELAGESEENAQQIEKDLPRTFTGKESLLPGGEQWNGLRNILSAFAAHCPGIGYVQAMNFIGAFLLLAGLREEDAFWALVIIVNEIVPGYFDEGMEVMLPFLHRLLLERDVGSKAWSWIGAECESGSADILRDVPGEAACHRGAPAIARR